MNNELSTVAAFLIDAERLKLVERRAYVSNLSRRENSAEHSWHLALGLITLAPRARSGDRFAAGADDGGRPRSVRDRRRRHARLWSSRGPTSMRPNANASSGSPATA